ncbi:MAG: dihydrodipicolinate synthase family protein [Thermoplasmatales archaeon]|jgi:dihydrodipicolinate synthase/N-acetylneuraminate lyase|nr:dihydrodipicolinate synthase family protein [Candidatus Thermoplasmatota archaeon]MCL6002185.1 dihydrodipicolinate synthase family protein [Candidatus Thermoplasmatota archaeon]MDA8055307.1 dihydrodipicolinate synthase family protein [Thermoplasmatales archaeon]
MPELKGIITPAVTPWKGDTIDYDAIDALMDFLGKISVSGVFPMGSSGAFPIISVEQHVKVLEYFMDKKKPNMFFLGGIGRNSVDETLTMGLYAKELGVDAVSIVTPYYLRMSQESIYRYYERLLSQIDIPVLIYNIPQNTNNNIEPQTVLKLKKQFSHVAGIKDSSGNFSNFSTLIDVVGKEVRVFQGQDDLLLPSLAMGAAGGINGTSNFCDLSVRVYNEFANSNFAAARKLQTVLSELKKLTNSLDFPQGPMAGFIEMVYHKDTESPFPLKDLEAEARKNFGTKAREILKKLET